MGEYDWQSSRKIKLNSKKMVIIAIVIISIVTIGILFVNLETRSTVENKKPVSDLPTSALQNSSISENVSYSSFKSKYVTTYSLPNGTGPNGILVDNNGLVWTSGSSSHSLFRLDFENGKLRSYPIPEEKRGQTMVWSMVEDKDGNIWFSQLGANPLWLFDPNTERFSLFHTSSPPFQMKVENTTGNIWFTTLTGNTIGVIQKVENKTEPSYKIIEFPTGQDTDPSGLFLKDGSVWVAELSKGKIAKFEVVRNNDDLVVNIKKTLEIPESNQTQFYTPIDVLVSGNRTVWVTEHGPSTMTKYDTISGKLTRFPTSQRPDGITTLPFWMRESTDGKGIWYDEHQGGRVAFFDLDKMDLTEYELQNNTANPVVYTLNLAMDPSDSSKLWFSQWNLDRVGVVDHAIPLPFDIKSNLTKVLLSDKNTTATINVEISGNDSVSQNHMVFLKVSSSMMPDGGFANMTGNFTVSSVDLSKVNQDVPVQFILQNQGANAGNYTLGISATDGIVTKTIFVDLNILQ
jgi:streptogramin lyase